MMTHDNHWRTYDAATGRLLSRDPLLDQETPNAYTYARNRPLQLIDPLGLWAGGVGAGISGGYVPIPGKVGAVGDADCYVATDGHGNWNILCCAGAGVGTGAGASWNAGASGAMCFDCDTVCDLTGDYGGLVAGAGNVGGGFGASMTGTTVTGSFGLVGGGTGGYAGWVYGSCKLMLPADCDECPTNDR